MLFVFPLLEPWTKKFHLPLPNFKLKKFLGGQTKNERKRRSADRNCFFETHACSSTNLLTRPFLLDKQTSPGGYYCPSTGLSSYSTCPSGQYSNDGASSCSNCAAGKYQDSSAQTSCISCPAGCKYSQESSNGRRSKLAPFLLPSVSFEAVVLLYSNFLV